MNKENIAEYISQSLKKLESNIKEEQYFSGKLKYIDFDDNDLSDIFDKKYYYPYRIRIELKGSSGASCWDNEPSVPYEGYGEYTDRPNLADIASKTIKEFNPKLSINDIIKIIQKVTYEEENSSDDYYGNYSSSVIISLDAKLLISEIEKSLEPKSLELV